MPRLMAKRTGPSLVSQVNPGPFVCPQGRETGDYECFESKDDGARREDG
jgi:hypothetical protein